MEIDTDLPCEIITIGKNRNENIVEKIMQLFSLPS